MNQYTNNKIFYLAALIILGKFSILKATAVKVDFLGGSSITGEVASWNGEEGVIKCDLGEVKVDKSKITHESIARIDGVTEINKSIDLFLANGSEIKGKVISWDGNTVTLEADLGKVSIEIEKLTDESKAKINGLSKNRPQPTTTTTTPSGNLAGINDAGDYRTLSKYIVIIEGDRSVGTGFLANLDGKTYLFTNLHVLDGNKSIRCKTMDGKELQLGKLLASTEYDLAAIELPQEKEGLELQQHIESSVMIGDEVFVFGNSFGGGVATDLNGKVLAVGPQVLETDVKFVSGNSGSPIISKKTHQVLGIASYCSIRKANDFGKDSKFNNVERRFAYRIDNNPGWQQMSVAQFVSETLFIKKAEARTDALWDVAHDIAHNDKVTKYSYRNEWDNKVDELMGPYLKKRDEFQGGVGSSRGDFKNLHEHFLRDLSNACTSDLKVNYQFCNWHQRNGETTIELLQNVRKMLAEFFEKKTQSL